jgi:hypothetical protein
VTHLGELWYSLSLTTNERRQMKHTVADGKYTLEFNNGKMTALRNGEPWDRDLTGDNLVYWMLVEIESLKEANKVLKQDRDSFYDALENIEGMYDSEVSCRTNSMSMYEAMCMARYALKGITK